VAGNAAFLKAQPTLAWLGQFEPEDQATAVTLLRAMTLVSRDAFADRLRDLILHRLREGQAPIGLYVERELRHRYGVPFRLFKESATKVHRAYGVGPKPVEPTKSYDADVGSEGIVAQLVSELSRAHPKQIFNHPGPDAIRKRRIRRFILVTDFIGSGKRASTYLEAAWRVRSVRSWWSARARTGLSFEVLAYAATPQGRYVVERHSCRPAVHVVIGCPTINTAFSDRKVRDLCNKYSPSKVMPPTGYGYGGALIAFAHGVPNNAPLILFKRSSSWAPLFPARVTAGTRRHFQTEPEAEEVHAHLMAMRQARLAEAGSVEGAKPHARNLLLVLAALSRSPREVEALSRKTGLTVLEVEAALTSAFKGGWIDGQNRLTDSGHAELAQARRSSASAPSLAKAVPFYYPKSLRAPR
jgi:hypothetical protein